MFTPILSLPVELQDALLEFVAVNTQSALSLSSTCRFYRTHLAPYVFKSITLRNNEKSGASVSAIAESSSCRYVKSLHYEGVASLPAEYRSREWTKECQKPLDGTKNVLPQSVDDLLSNLYRFPELEELIIEFPFDEEEWTQSYWSLEDMYDHGNAPGFAGKLQELEEVYEWGALMGRAFAAVARNKNHGIKTLELRQLVAKSVSALHTPSWRAFLNNNERFRMSLCGWEDPADRLLTMEDYFDFVSTLDATVFDHLSNVHHFTLIAPETGPLGLDSDSRIRLALSARQMPQLQTVHLEYCVVGPEMERFLVGHASTLDRIMLHNCFAEDGFTWVELFDALTAAQPKSLQLLDFLPVNAPLTHEEAYHMQRQEEEESQGVQRVRRALREDGSRRVFAYGYLDLDPEIGRVLHDPDMNINAFVQGDDQRAYNGLMAIVEENSRVVEAGAPQDKKIESTQELE